MTNPTADAIAALEPFANALYVRQIDDRHVTASPLTAANFRRAREVRSALLSAQGQAGKPDAMRQERDRAYEQSARDLVRLTTARTALEAAETVLQHIKAMTGAPDAPILDTLDPALTSVSAALATITEKDDGHGRGDLKALRDRLRAATGEDTRLDADISYWDDFGPESEWENLGGFWRQHKTTGVRERFQHRPAAHYTASIDAALALCERKLPGWGFKCECNLGFGIEVTLGHVGPDKFYDRPQGFGTGPTLPLAILIALLEALIGKETGDG